MSLEGRKSFCTWQGTVQSPRHSNSEDSLGLFLKLLLYSLKKLFVHFKLKILGRHPTTRTSLTSAPHCDGKSCRGGKRKVHSKKSQLGMMNNYEQGN